VLDGRVEREIAANAASNRHDFLIGMERAEKIVASKKARAEALERGEEEPRPGEPPIDLGGLRVAGG
jgi:hypothetical protein